MARDHALALSCEPGQGVLRLYGWAAPTLSFGRNEPARGRYDLRAAERRGVGFVRRPTGGRAVVHHREVTYAVVVPLRALGRLRETYRRINRALVGGLARLGVRADIATGDGTGSARQAPLTAGPCFRRPSEGEIVVGGGKLVGSAQARIGRALLQHGSILLGDDQALADTLAVDGAGRPGETRVRPVTLDDLLNEVPGPARVGRAVASGFRREFGGSWEEAPCGTIPGARELEERYRSRDWTWRR